MRFQALTLSHVLGGGKSRSMSAVLILAAVADLLSPAPTHSADHAGSSTRSAGGAGRSLFVDAHFPQQKRFLGSGHTDQDEEENDGHDEHEYFGDDSEHKTKSRVGTRLLHRLPHRRRRQNQQRDLLSLESSSWTQVDAKESSKGPDEKVRYGDNEGRKTAEAEADLREGAVVDAGVLGPTVAATNLSSSKKKKSAMVLPSTAEVAHHLSSSAAEGRSLRRHNPEAAKKKKKAEPERTLQGNCPVGCPKAFCDDCYEATLGYEAYDVELCNKAYLNACLLPTRVVDPTDPITGTPYNLGCCFYDCSEEGLAEYKDVELAYRSTLISRLCAELDCEYGEEPKGDSDYCTKCVGYDTLCQKTVPFCEKFSETHPTIGCQGDAIIDIGYCICDAYEVDYVCSAAEYNSCPLAMEPEPAAEVVETPGGGAPGIGAAGAVEVSSVVTNVTSASASNSTNATAVVDNVTEEEEVSAEEEDDESAP